MIEVDQLTKTYGSTAAIEDVSFKVEPGEILGFLGPNGAGKTTTMRILTGYLPATEGTARVAGNDVHTDSMAVRKSIGYLPETPPLYLEMTVEGFLTFVARLKGVSAGDRVDRVTSAIARCNLQEKRKVIIRKLSKGFRQRVGIAQAIVHNPPVIILDEPTVGLDPRQIIEVRNLIKSLAGEHTIILSTHILPEVSMTCDRITIINQGKIVATDSPERLVERLTGRSGYTVELRGEPKRSLEVLQSVPGVVKVSAVSAEHDMAEGLGRFQVMTGLGFQDVGTAIAQTVVEQGLDLFELSRSRASLEDVFLNLTTQESAENIDASDVSAAPAGSDSKAAAEDSPTPGVEISIEVEDSGEAEDSGDIEAVDKREPATEPDIEPPADANRDDSAEQTGDQPE